MTAVERALYITTGIIAAAFTIVALMVFDIMPTPSEYWAEHQATKRMMDVEWGIRTFPQEADQ